MFGRCSTPALLVFTVAATLLVVACAKGSDKHQQASTPTAQAARCETRTGGERCRAPKAATLFSPTSPWNTRLGRNAKIDPESQPRVRALAATIAATTAQKRPAVINTSAYSTPVYVVGRRARRVRVRLDHRYGAGLRRVLRRGVPIPRKAVESSGSDGHLTVYQPSTDTMWELWQATKKADGWHASWGGAIRNVSRNPGIYSPKAWPAAGRSEGWYWGSTASSLPISAGLITGDDLRSGRIEHALAAAVPDACAGVFVWPAQRTDGASRERDCMPEGSRLRLDPAVDVSKLRISPIARMLARAAQRYGIIVRDVTHSNFAFFGEDPHTAGASVYKSAGPVGGLTYKSLAGFPWDRLQVVAARECTKAPCRR
jgi:hypothetical protein